VITPTQQGLRLLVPPAPGWSAYVDADWIPSEASVPAVSLLRGLDGTLTHGGLTLTAPSDISADQAAAAVLEAVVRSVVEIAAACGGETVEVVGRGIIAARVRSVVNAAPGTGPVDIVIDTTGDPVSITMMLTRLRDDGALILAGRSQRMSIDLYRDVHRRGLHLIGAPNPLDGLPRTWAPVPPYEPPTSITLGEPPPPEARWYRVTG
jgi:hypothetical protein